MAPPKVTTIASFPAGFFLENIIVRHDSSILISVMTHNALYYLPPPTAIPVEPVLLHKFAEHAMGMIEAEPDIFYISSSAMFEDHHSVLHRLDMRSFSLDNPPKPVPVLTFPAKAQGLNGTTALSPTVLLLADSWANLIWRVDLDNNNGEVKSHHVWLEHPSMACNLGVLPDCPGINGIKFCSKNTHVYYTTTVQKSLSRVRVNPDTLEPAGEPEFVAGGMMGDDFIIDEEKGVLYVATHRENTIEAVDLEPGKEKAVVIGEPLNTEVLGPTAGAWGRQAGELGKVAYFTSDGGLKRPLPDGVVRPAKVFRVEF